MLNNTSSISIDTVHSILKADLETWSSKTIKVGIGLFKKLQKKKIMMEKYITADSTGEIPKDLDFKFYPYQNLLHEDNSHS